MDKNKTREVATHTVDELQKLALSFIPAGVILDSFLGYWSRLKQKRVIDFSERLRDILEQHAGRELTASDFENEDFIDIMESVYSEVVRTQSAYKLERFRNILAKQIIAPIEIDESIKYIQILRDIQDADLVILLEMKNTKMNSELSVIRILTGRDIEFGDDDFSIQLQAGNRKFEITAGDVEFYINRLISLGLLNKRTVNMPGSVVGRKSNVKQFQSLSISKMGKKFLAYIERDSN